MKHFLLTFFLLSLPGATQAQEPEYRIGKGVIAPVLIKSVAPDYTEAGDFNRINGAVLLEVLIDKTGVPAEITIIGPLGYGLKRELEALGLRCMVIAPALLLMMMGKCQVPVSV